MKMAVILVALGGPRRLSDVPAFVKRFTGRELPSQAMAEILNRYRRIGGYSPIVAITEKQAELLGQTLGDDYLCLPAFGYVEPCLEEVIAATLARGIKKVLILFMSPFYAYVTCDDYLRRIDLFRKNNPSTVKILPVLSWYKEESFVEVWVEKIKDIFTEEGYFIFSAHSLPKGEKTLIYEDQVKELVEAVALRVGLKNYAVGWQSIPAGIDKTLWLTPTTDELITEAASQGFKTIVLVPIGFTADHIETLYDIDIFFRSLVETRGIDYKRISSLNFGSSFINTLRRIVLKNEQMFD